MSSHDAKPSDVVAPPRAARVRTYLKALIEFNHGAVQVACVVKNLSASGARLEVATTVALPDVFALRIPHRSESYRCRMVRNVQGVVGVTFLEQQTEAGATPEPASPDGLESENRRLRKRVRELTLRLEALGQDPLIDERV